VRLLPPLILTEAEATEGVRRLGLALADVAEVAAQRPQRPPQ
jgi:acetylornithine/succinyldiaminopimelate/putrescine aminotransferase